MYNQIHVTAFLVNTIFAGSIQRILILTLLLTLPMISYGQWEYETVTTGGTKCDIAVDTNCNPHISYRVQADGWDLKYAHWDGTDWQIAEVETTENVYGAPSIAVDDSGIPHIVFKKANSFWTILYHAWWNGSSWQQEGLDSLAWDDLGEWSSITIASDGYPHVVYTSDNDSYLKYAYQNASGWHSEFADSLLNEEFHYVSLALDVVNHPHVSYYLANARELRYAYLNGLAWQVETVDTEGAVGHYSSIAVDDEGSPHIGYTNYWGVPPTKYTHLDGSTWQFEYVDPSDDALELYTSLALDTDNRPHMSYGEYFGSLKYAFKDESWKIEIVDETVECGWTSIAVDDSGSTHIAYYDQSLLALKYAKKSLIPVDMTPPSAPQVLIAHPGNSQVSLEWLMNLEIDVTQYLIYAGTSMNPTTLIDSTNSRSDTTKIIEELTRDIVYYFRITAVDTAGNESGYSNEVSATPIGLSRLHVSTTGSDVSGDGSEGAPFATIQYSINSASNGDTVLVLPGTYVENINYNGKNVILGSLFITTLDTSYISQTVIDGNSNESVVTFENDEDSTAVLSGFTIINGSALFGGGIKVEYSNPSLENITVSGNIASGPGGGISFQNSTSSRLVNVIVSGNTAAHWGGGISCRSASPSMINITVMENIAGAGGGGIACADTSNPSLEKVLVESNSANYGGGISTDVHSSPTLTDVTVSRNTAFIYGGGIYCNNNSNPALNGVTISDNTANSNGGGIACDNWSSPSLVNVTIEDNSATDGEGGGIYLHYSSPTLTDVTVSGNTAALWGGGISCGDQSSPILENVLISDNVATHLGGGVSGWYFANLTLTNVQILSNSARSGGGIALWDSCSLILENVQFRWNSATEDGGGLYIRDSNPAMNNVDVLENQATNKGGGLYLDNSNLIWEGIFVERNSASYGGGLYTNGDCALLNMTIVTNVSEKGFGGIYTDNGSLTISNSNIAYNGMGLYNTDNANFTNAVNNWWGSPSGPYHPNFNNLGNGDSTNSYVYVAPWLATPDTVAPPVPPQNLRVTRTGDDFISLAWDPSPLADFAKFVLHYRIAGENNFPAIYLGEDTSYTIIGLTPNTRYHIDMTLRDNDGNGSWFSNGFYASTVVNGPDEFDLIFPEDSAEVTTLTPTFLWNQAIDPDLADTIRYRIFYGSTILNLIEIDLDTDTSWQVPLDLLDNSTYYWKILALDPSGAATENTGGYHSFTTNTGSLVYTELSQIPDKYSLDQNYPNPFNPTTTIQYGLPENTDVTLYVYDITGQEVARLVDHSQVAGWYTIRWNGTNQDGTPVGTGMYFARFQAGKYSKVIKMVYLR